MKPTGSDPTFGRAAPSLVLPLADGGELSLAKLRGQPVLVTFLSHAA